MEKKNNPLLMIAGILLILTSVPSFIKGSLEFIMGSLEGGLYAVIMAVGLLISAIGLFAERKTLCVVGFGALACLACGITVISLYDGFPRYYFNGGEMLHEGLSTALLFLFLLLAVIVHNHASVWLGILAVLCFFLSLIILPLYYSIDIGLFLYSMIIRPFVDFSAEFERFGILWAVSGFYYFDLYTLIPIASVLIGIGMSKKNTESMTIPAAKKRTAGTIIDKLTQLKGLLDKGVITQEEFEEKKKEILEND